MQEGWECKKCHNIMAPNTPFCLFCWFQSQQNQAPIMMPNPVVEEVKITEPEPQPELKPTPIIKPVEQKSLIHANKNLILDHVDITIPVLNKEPTVPRADKWPDTKIYLGGIGHSKERAIARKFRIPYILDSIIDLPVQPSQLVRKYFDYVKRNNSEYLLDSGAFSYMNNPKKSFDLASHLKQYCYYINEFDIKDFVELDLDIFMSLEEVENTRRKIYLETHKQPIVVFHTERGKDYWTKMCKENEFVAIGGLVVGNNWNSADGQKELCDMCDEAHMYGTRVHGLGFTPLTLLNSHTMFFDTVDSTSWNFTKRGCTAAINEKGELEKLEGSSYFSASEGQENDLKIWAQFAENYRGGPRI